MDSFGSFDQIEGSDAIPRYDQMGRLLSPDEREQIARRKGLCMRCGMKTHQGAFKRPLTDDNCYKGTCIRCNPNAVPKRVLESWNLKNRPANVQLVSGAAQANAVASGITLHGKHLLKKATRSVMAAGRATNKNGRVIPTGPSTTIAFTSEHSTSSNLKTGSSTSSEVQSSQPPLPQKLAPLLHAQDLHQPWIEGKRPSAHIPSLHSESSSMRQTSTSTIGKLSPTVSDRSLYSAESFASSASHVSTKCAASGCGIGTNNGNCGREPSVGADQNANDDLMASEYRQKPAKSAGLSNSVRLNSSRNDLDLSSPSNIRSKYLSNRSHSKMIEDDWTGGSQEMTHHTIIETLKAARADPVKLRQALHVLRNGLEVDLDGSLIIIARDILSQYVFDPSIADAACGAVWRITTLEDSLKSLAIESGIVGLLVDALKAHHEDATLCEWALGALTTLACSPFTKSDLAKTGVIEAVLELLDFHQNSAGILEWTSRCLHNLVHQYVVLDVEAAEEEMQAQIKKNISSIIEANGVSTLLNAMKLHATEPIALLWATKLMWRLFGRKEESSTVRVLFQLRQDGFVPLSTKLLRQQSTSSELFQLISRLVCMLLLKMDDGALYETASDAMPSIVRQMEEFKDDETLQEAGCRLLCALSNGGESVQENLKEADGILAIVKTMERLPENLMLLTRAGWCLWRLSANPSLFDSGLVEKSLQALSSAMDSHRDSVDLLVSTCGFSRNSTMVDGVSPTAYPLDVIFRWLTTVGQASHYKVQASQALHTLSRKYNDFLHLLNESVGIPRMIASLRDPQSCCRIDICCILTVLARNSEDSRQMLASADVVQTALAELAETNDLNWKACLLRLVSTILVSECALQIDVPIHAIQTAIGGVEGSTFDPSLSELACICVRNLLLTPNSRVGVEGLVKAMTDTIDTCAVSDSLCIEACYVIWALTSKYSDRNPSELSAMMTSLIGLMGKFMEPLNLEIQSAAAGTLASVLASVVRSPIPLKVQDVEVVISVIYKIIDTKPGASEAIEHLLAVLWNCCLVDENTLVQGGVVVAVIDTMVDNESNLQIQERGCTILALLASAENLEVNFSIAETNGVELLVSALAVFGDNVNVTLQACKCFSYLSIDPELRVMIVAQGGLRLVVVAITSNPDNAELVGFACSTLLNLTFDAEVSAYIGSGIVDAIVQTMTGHLKSALLQETGLGILQNISMRGPDEKARIAEAGGVEAVVSVLREHIRLPSVVERGLATLWSLAVLDENQIRVANADGINLVVNCMMALIEYERVQKQGCGCLCALAGDSTSKVLLRNAGGLDAIVFAMWAHFNKSGVQKEGCRAISNLVHDPRTNEIMLVSETEVGAILSAMRRFPSVADLQMHACYSLRNLTLSVDNVAVVLGSADDIRELVAKVSLRNPECSPIVNQILSHFG
jgi:hypothetical protein